MEWSFLRADPRLCGASEPVDFMRALDLELWSCLCPPRQAYEYLNEEVFQDLTTDVGFLHAIGLALRLAERGLLYGAVPCESFSFMAYATHRRCGARPFGEVFPFVLRGSICCTRMVLLSLIVAVRSCVYFIENPNRTALLMFPPVQVLVAGGLQPRLVKWSGAKFVDEL